MTGWQPSTPRCIKTTFNNDLQRSRGLLKEIIFGGISNINEINVPSNLPPVLTMGGGISGGDIVQKDLLKYQTKKQFKEEYSLRFDERSNVIKMMKERDEKALCLDNILLQPVSEGFVLSFNNSHNDEDNINYVGNEVMNCDSDINNDYSDSVRSVPILGICMNKSIENNVDINENNDNNSNKHEKKNDNNDGDNDNENINNELLHFINSDTEEENDFMLLNNIKFLIKWRTTMPSMQDIPTTPDNHQLNPEEILPKEILDLLHGMNDPLPKIIKIESQWIHLKDLIKKNAFIIGLDTNIHLPYKTSLNWHWTPLIDEKASEKALKLPRGKNVGEHLRSAYVMCGDTGCAPPYLLTVSTKDFFDDKEFLDSASLEKKKREVMTAQEKEGRIQNASSSSSSSSFSFMKVPKSSYLTISLAVHADLLIPCDDVEVPASPRTISSRKATIRTSRDYTPQAANFVSNIENKIDLSASIRGSTGRTDRSGSIMLERTRTDNTNIFYSTSTRSLPSDVVIVLQELRHDEKDPLVMRIELSPNANIPITRTSFHIPSDRINPKKDNLIFWVRLFSKASVHLSVCCTVPIVLGDVEEIWTDLGGSVLVRDGKASVTRSRTEQLLFRLPLQVSSFSNNDDSNNEENNNSNSNNKNNNNNNSSNNKNNNSNSNDNNNDDSNSNSRLDSISNDLNTYSNNCNNRKTNELPTSQNDPSREITTKNDNPSKKNPINPFGVSKDNLSSEDDTNISRGNDGNKPELLVTAFLHIFDREVARSVSMLLLSNYEGENSDNENSISSFSMPRIDANNFYLSESSKHCKTLIGRCFPSVSIQSLYNNDKDNIKAILPSFKWKLYVISLVPLANPPTLLHPPSQSIVRSLQQRYKGFYKPNNRLILFRDVFLFDQISFPVGLRISILPLPPSLPLSSSSTSIPIPIPSFSSTASSTTTTTTAAATIMSSSSSDNLYGISNSQDNSNGNKDEIKNNYDIPENVHFIVRLYRKYDRALVSESKGCGVLQLYNIPLDGLLPPPDMNHGTASPGSAPDTPNTKGKRNSGSKKVVQNKDSNVSSNPGKVEFIIECQLDEQLMKIPIEWKSRLPFLFNTNISNTSVIPLLGNSIKLKKNEGYDERRPLTPLYSSIPPTLSKFLWEIDILAGTVLELYHDTYDIEKQLDIKNNWEEFNIGRADKASAAMNYFIEKKLLRERTIKSNLSENSIASNNASNISNINDVGPIDLNLNSTPPVSVERLVDLLSVALDKEENKLIITEREVRLLGLKEVRNLNFSYLFVFI